ncbi:cell division protein FtsA [Jeotgalibacillus proteolyticus]|uniref:Cell division protein FtsA n=1 Tax=Jeotgalibacillus proteolyticus TaxID=2082395 RepID=A0A2S5GGU1_9BACL|nr:cell division protein FtsA [Jeotgalibacillus proteolyticus]PPA72131.1 cell division protein FtsA [Jeotgalibacillus proteolyticus]
MSNNEYFVSLDIGTSNVKVIIAELVHDSLNIIGVGNVQSEGIRKGSIVDIDETVRSIQKAVDQAERMTGLDIHNVIVGIPGNHVSLQPCHGVVAVSTDDKEIRDEDVARVIDAAQVMPISPEREIINIVPRQFIVDGLDEIKDPRGMIGVRLEMEGTVITGSKTMLHNILRCVERAGLEIADIFLQPLAAGTIALSKDEQSLGTAILDIGGGSTSIAVFEQGNLIATSIVPVGGEHITKDLSIGLRTTTDDAESIKIKHGHAFYDYASEEEVFSVPIIGSDQHQQFNQLEISDIIEVRLEEMFDLVINELKRLNIHNLPGGFVLSGGVANMQGILELGQAVLQNQVRVAIPDYIGVREPQYTTAVGLIKYAHKHAKLQGRLDKQPSASEYEGAGDHSSKKQPESRPKQPKPKQKNEEGKFKKLLGYFFE